jgi:hypothetical protein
MQQFSTKEKFETDINNIWDNPKYADVPFRQYGYAIQDEIITNALLFIGLNPSRGDEHEMRFFYNNEQQGRTVHKYFLKFQDISESVNMPWAHFDLLFVRETNQANIPMLFHAQNGTDFVLDQLRLAEKVIEMAKPKIIVVNNTMARWFLGKDRHFDPKMNREEGVWLGWHFEFDHKIGTYRIVNHPKLSGVPIFFTSMLTGQRALDRGSYERLIWHIQFVMQAKN